jgi:uncharacterized membrane protein YecN with MAPEG domain
MKQNYGSEHQKVLGLEIQKGGYPDNGSGYYAKNLGYAEWYKFNNAQRAHINYVEWIASCLVFLLIGGIKFAIPSACIGGGIIIARFIYACGYANGGPKGRIIGALANDLLVLGQFVLAIISCIYMITGS